MLENQCHIWPDPIAAVVYVPTLRGRVASAEDASLNGSVLAEAVGRATAFFNRMQLQGRLPGTQGLEYCMIDSRGPHARRCYAWL